MQVEIYLKDGKEKFIKNVKSISNMVDFVDGKPVFYLRMTVGNDDNEIKYEDINSFSVYDAESRGFHGDYNLSSETAAKALTILFADICDNQQQQINDLQTQIKNLNKRMNHCNID